MPWEGTISQKVHDFMTSEASGLPSHERRAFSLWTGTFYPFQRNWLWDPRKLAALNKCRQIGGSHTYAGWGVLRGAMYGDDSVYVSRAEQEAKDLKDIAAKHARALHSMGSQWARVVRETTTSLHLASGAEIRSTTSTAAGRGFSGNVLLDEFAYHQDPDAVWDAALAATQHGYLCRICSTPNGVGNVWWDLIENICVAESADSNPERGWKSYLTTIHDAIADGMRIELADAWDTARHDKRIFAQLYMGSFLDGSFQYIPTDLIKRAIRNKAFLRRAPVYAGLDIGENRDKTVLVIVQEFAPGQFNIVHHERHEHTDDLLVDRLVKEAFSLHGAKRLSFDATGAGSFPAKAASRRYGPKFKPIKFTQQKKEEMATRMHEVFSQDAISIPTDDKQMVIDVSAIKREVTAAGTVRYTADHTKLGHADSAFALMLSLDAAKGGEVKPTGAYKNMKRGMRR